MIWWSYLYVKYVIIDILVYFIVWRNFSFPHYSIFEIRRCQTLTQLWHSICHILIVLYCIIDIERIRFFGVLDLWRCGVFIFIPFTLSGVGASFLHDWRLGFTYGLLLVQNYLIDRIKWLLHLFKLLFLFRLPNHTRISYWLRYFHCIVNNIFGLFDVHFYTL